MMKVFGAHVLIISLTHLMLSILIVLIVPHTPAQVLDWCGPTTKVPCGTATCLVVKLGCRAGRTVGERIRLRVFGGEIPRADVEIC